MSWSNRLQFSIVFFVVFIESLMQYSIDCNAFDSKNFNDFCFSQWGQAVGYRFKRFTMPSTFIISASTIYDPDIQASVSGTSTTRASSRT